MENNELRHYGIKGMKWGVRRFQNEDGSYTAAGKRRAKQQKAESMSDEELAARVKRLNMEKTYKKLSKESEPKSTLEKSKDVVDSASSLANRLKEADRKAASSKPKPRMDLSNMSDKEMRDRINRELLERQYNDLFAQPDSVSKGRQYVFQIIDSVGTGLAIGGSALSIARAVQKLSKESEPKSTLEKSKDVVDSASSLANRLKEADRKAASSKPKPRMDLSNMSDKEMRDRINRELLERQYNDLFAQPDSVSKGRQYVFQIIDSVGTGLAIGGSALSIARAVQKLKKG